jgi:cytochrome c556
MKRLLLATASVAALLTALPAAAQFAKPEDAVKYRKAGMTLIGAHFGRIGAMAQGRVPFDATAAAVNADIVATVAKLPFAGFVDGTASTDKGGAKANIWTDKAKFDAGAQKMADEVAKLQAAAKSGNLDQLKTAVGGVGGTCKACHDDHRNQ